MKSRYVIALAFLCLLASCTAEQQPEVTVFTLSVPGGEGKVAFGAKEADTYPLLWESGDRISVNGVQSEALSEAQAGGRSAGFTLASSVSSPYYVVYPGTSFVTPKRTSFVLSEQTHNPGSCPSGTTVLMRRTGSSSGVEMTNMCGYIRFNIVRGEDNSAFTKMVFKGNDSEVLDGTFNISFTSSGIPSIESVYSAGGTSITLTGLQETGEYIVTVPAITFQKGFTFTVYADNDRFMRLKTNSSVTVGQGMLINAPSAVYSPNGRFLGGDTPDSGDGGEVSVQIHTVMDMNKEAAVVNSHSGEELQSVLQPMYDLFQIIGNDFLLQDIDTSVLTDQAYATYPRIKYLPDGTWAMFYHGGQIGSRVWVTRSSDFKTWTKPTMLFKPVKVTIDGEDDWIRYVNPDAVVLPDGELLMVVSHRATNHYSQGTRCGLSFRRSSDNGKTWGSAYSVETMGSNWEPYLLVLPDGTLHCYYTDGYAPTWNSGTGLIVSTDNGYTWSSPIRVCQEYKYDYYTATPEKVQYNGQKIYTDQMPCFRVLNDDKTIVGFLEGRHAKPSPPADCEDKDSYSSYYSMSLVYNPSLAWSDVTSYSVALTSPSGSNRNKVVATGGAGGYISTFPSGEIVFSWTSGSLVTLRMGDATARNFSGTSWTSSDLYKPFAYNGYWACSESFSQNYLAIGVHGSNKNTGDLGMQIGMMYLNQRLNAQKNTSVSVDGKLSDWKTTRALYVCAPSGEQAIVRVCHNGTELFLAVECVDDALAESTKVNLRLALGTTQKITMALNKDGKVSASSTSVNVKSAVGNTADGKQGWLGEVSVPLSTLGASSGSELRIYADIEVGGKTWPITNETTSSRDNWQRIKVK